jgi:glycosyltransferase involved in cell wall biosynthesis
MRVLHVLTYFVPHVSGLTIHVDRLTRLLAERGVASTVLASRSGRDLPLHEIGGGVEIVRVPVLFAIGKGVVMRGFSATFERLSRDADIVHLHVPQLEAGSIALLARRSGKPLVVTVHCDLVPGPGLLARASVAVVTRSARKAAQLADRVVTYTEDYLFGTSFFDPFRGKARAILPPTDLDSENSQRGEELRARCGIAPGAPVIGFAARWAADKGIDTLLEAVASLRKEERFEDLVLLCAGPREETLGENVTRRLASRVTALGPAIALAGTLPESRMGDFYHAVDVLALPSVNRTESFGLVQVEALRCGVPVVASDLPGVRTVVSGTGAGLLVSPGDAGALATALAHVLEDPARFRPDPAALAERYDSGRIAAEWIALYRELLGLH